jgi:hypothetical protein
MQADVDGHQRKVVTSRVRPARAAHGDDGIPLRRGHTLPFVVERAWNAPMGHYPEQFFIVDPGTREVLYASPLVERAIWGLQSLTEVADEVSTPIELAPGNYLVVFALGGVKGGEIDVEATEVEDAAA